MWWDEALNSNKLSEKETTGNYQDGNMETTAWRADWDSIIHSQFLHHSVEGSFSSLRYELYNITLGQPVSTSLRMFVLKTQNVSLENENETINC